MQWARLAERAVLALERIAKASEVTAGYATIEREYRDHLVELYRSNVGRTPGEREEEPDGTRVG